MGTKWNKAAGPMPHRRHLKVFDLKVGDRVRAVAHDGRAKDDRIRGIAVVTAIYPDVFVVKTQYGYSSSFSKIDYSLGDVAKVSTE